MEISSQRFSQMAHGALVLFQAERARPGRYQRFEAGFKKIQVGAARLKLGRSACPTFLIMDAQSAKNTDTAALKGYDTGKKVSGIKRHIAVNTQGLPHAVQVTTAEVLLRSGITGRVERKFANRDCCARSVSSAGHTCGHQEPCDAFAKRLFIM